MMCGSNKFKYLWEELKEIRGNEKISVALNENTNQVTI